MTIALDSTVAVYLAVVLYVIAFYSRPGIVRVIARLPFIGVTCVLCLALGMELVDPNEKRRAQQRVEHKEQRKTPPYQDVDANRRRFMFVDTGHVMAHAMATASVMPGGSNAEWEDGSSVQPLQSVDEWKDQRTCETITSNLAAARG